MRERMPTSRRTYIRTLPGHRWLLPDMTAAPAQLLKRSRHVFGSRLDTNVAQGYHVLRTTAGH
jgi:hypothetical protein